MSPDNHDHHDPHLDDMERRLIDLGHHIDGPEPAADLVQRVWERDPMHRRNRQTRGRWLTVLVALAVIIALGFTPPVRAAVTDLLRIGGVLIQTEPTSPVPTAGPTSASAPGPGMPSGAAMSVAEAREAVDFELMVPDDLGDPDQVVVTDDRRVVSMRWGTGSDVIIWDQFDGRLSPVYRKQASADVESVSVRGRDGVWLDEPHPLIYLDENGNERTAQRRLAGPTLVFVVDGVTVRLEGEPSRQEAIGIAASALR